MHYFYDPHPGNLGAVMRLPDVLRRRLFELADNYADLDVVIQQIGEIAKNVDVEISLASGMILGKHKTSDGYIHCWRLLRYSSQLPPPKGSN